jgi:hypothetical protein
MNPFHNIQCYFWKKIVILSSDIYLGIPSDIFTSGIPTRTRYVRRFIPMRPACPVHLVSFDSITNIWRGVQIMKLFITQFHPSSNCFIPPRSRYSPQHPILKPPSVYVLPLISETKLHIHGKLETIYLSIYLSLLFPLAA